MSFAIFYLSQDLQYIKSIYTATSVNVTHTVVELIAAACNTSREWFDVNGHFAVKSIAFLSECHKTKIRKKQK